MYPDLGTYVRTEVPIRGALLKQPDTRCGPELHQLRNPPTEASRDVDDACLSVSLLRRLRRPLSTTEPITRRAFSPAAQELMPG